MIAPDGKQRYMCESCGGTGHLPFGRYWDAKANGYIDYEGPCFYCDGTSWLGEINQGSQNESHSTT